MNAHLPVYVHFLSGDLIDSSDVKSNDIVAGAELSMDVWHMWSTLIEAVAADDIDWVCKPQLILIMFQHPLYLPITSRLFLDK